VPSPYSALLMEHFRRPRNLGTLPEATIVQEGTNPLCGDRVRIELLVRQGIVHDARFTANACAICVASASMLTELMHKAPLDEVETLTVDDLLRSMQAQVPAGRMNCVRLPLTVLHTGVHLYRNEHAPRTATRKQTIAAIVLAAGQARRFGAQKLVAPFADSTVIRTVVESVRAASIDCVVVVVGEGADPIRVALAGLDVGWAVNPNSSRGMSSSISAGMQALPGEADAVMVVLGDQPTVDQAVLMRLVETWRERACSIVAPRYRGQRGNPVLFDKALFADLRSFEGDRGARDFIDANPTQLELIDVEATAPIDIDTPADYDALLREQRSRPKPPTV
jgi:molybdenum cofactor cytidylyltransferase